MKFPKLDLPWLVLCISAITLFALGGARVTHASNDFVPVYTGALCLLHGCDPYQPSQLEQQFFAAGGQAKELPSWQIDVPVYPPSTFLALSPLALLRFPVARWVWFLLNGSLFVLSAMLVLSMCPAHRWLATVLVSFIVATAGILLVLGQPGMFAISTMILGTCLLLLGRLLPLGTLMLMLSLAVKPQIGGLLVLYLVIRRIHWRYAAVSLAGAGALLLCAGLILRHHPRSAGWTSTLQSNLSTTLSPGGSADPRPQNPQAIGDINLQTLSSIFFADARKFNTAAYALFLGLMAAGVAAVLRASRLPETHLIALAALSILSLMPVYHRFYDSRLLLLSVPAAMIVFEKRRLLGASIVILTALSAVSIQYRLQMSLLESGQWHSVVANKFLLILLLRQQNLELFLLYCLYLAAIFSFRSPGAAAMQANPMQRVAIPLEAG
ncbi:MAG: glycosyltransferase family 87 protein [Acidobacteriaceae bacterium]